MPRELYSSLIAEFFMSSVRSSPRAATFAAIALVMACTGDSTAQTAGEQAAPPTAVPPAAAKAPSAVRSQVARALPDFAPLVEAVGPAVVNVEVTQQRQPVGQGGDPFFEEFRRRFGIPDPDDQGVLRGAGSGFIVSPDGYILTNAHVVEGADEVTVRLTDRREFVAKVIGTDPRSDIAVIKIDSKNLPFVRFGDPTKLKPGEWVLAIGAPFGFENSATAGIVSATSRSLPDQGGATNYVPFIQTDVAVNPGNSGGPLFNLDGEVVGINSQIFSRTGGYMGLSFAIPIDVADNVRQQLVKTGRVTRGRIGVVIQEVNAQHAESFGLDRPRGALVARVEEDSPGAKAGLKPGDVILSVDGRAIERSGDLPTIIGRTRPGTDARLEIWRDRRARTVAVRVGELEEPREQRTALRPRSDGAQGQQAPQLGLAVRPLDQEEKQRIETKGTLVITQVSGPAAAADLRRGDIVLGVNDRPVRTVEELREAASKSGKTVSLLIQRGENQIFVPLRIG
jgi:serine protease Do